MPKTVQESFRQYAANLNITDKQVETVSICRNNVVKVISKELSLHKSSSKLIGSYDRDTSIRLLSEGDVDVMVILHYGDNKDWDTDEGTSKVLAKLKSILEEAYPKTVCSIDRNCVTMKLSKFNLDVVPAFANDAGYYTIPDTWRKKWLKTDPTKFAAEVTRINKNMDGCFVPLIKMVKGWNREYSKKLRSFHLECLLINHYKDYDKSYTYDSMLNIFFGKLPGYLTNPSYEPINGDRVDWYLDNGTLGNKRKEFIDRAKQTSELSDEAYLDSQNLETEVAINEWKDILGDFFPTYG